MVTTIMFITSLSFFLIAYVYVGYPFVLYVIGKLKKSKFVNKNDRFTPDVTLMISCYNEVEVVQEKIHNALELDYPKEKLTIIVISDGSDDGTDEVALEYSGHGVKLVRQEGRLGKTSAINLAMEECKTDFVVFSDANAMYQADALRKLVRNFNDEKVGYVVGAALYTDGNENSAAASEELYWRYEIALKKMESKIHSVVGGDGAIYAIRRKLYKKLDQKDINDFVNPLQIIEQGFRGIFEPEAICLEETAGDFNKEYKRKQRIVNRSFRGLMKVKAVMNPFKSGFFSFEVISHKLLRWLQPVFIVIAALGSVYLAFQEIPLFVVFSQLGIVFLWLAQIGFLKSKQQNMSKLFFVPYYFLMVNYYSLMGVITALRGDIQVTWSTPRAAQDGNQLLSNKTKVSLLAINSLLLFLFLSLLT